METLADLYNKLQAQSKKSSPAVPSDLEYPTLETVSACFMRVEVYMYMYVTMVMVRKLVFDSPNIPNQGLELHTHIHV